MIKEIIKNAYIEGGRLWLHNLIKQKGNDFYYQNKSEIKECLKDLGFDSSEASSKLYKFEKGISKNV